MRKLFLPLILSLLLLPGCALSSFETGSLMHPPRATGEMAKIQDLITKEVGADIIFKYPLNGDYRSAIIMHDIDNDGEDEAIAIYQVVSEQTGSHVMIMDKINGEFVKVGDFLDQSSDVDKVSFADLRGDGRDDLILGWNSYNNSGKTMTTYLYENNEYVAMKFRETYSDFVAGDFDGDSKSEILALSLSRTDTLNSQSANIEDSVANAKLIKFNEDIFNFDVIGSSMMDSKVIKYGSIKFGQINSYQVGAVIDSIVAGSAMETEIVYWDNSKNRLVSPLFNKYTTFLRNSLVISDDINSDGMIEIPVMDQEQYGSHRNDAYILSFVRYETEKDQFYNIESLIKEDINSYIFIVPEIWKDGENGEYKILVLFNNDVVRICKKEQSEGKIVAGEEIIRISVISKQELKDLNKNDENIILNQDGDKVYVAKISNKESTLAISEQEIRKDFRLI